MNASCHHRNTRTILVVDNFPASRQALRAVLNDRGCDLHDTLDSKTVLAFIEKKLRVSGKGQMRYINASSKYVKYNQEEFTCFFGRDIT